jgi:hypothetical protein
MRRNAQGLRSAYTYLSRPYNDANDLFAVNPLRRSAWVVGVCWALILVPVYLLHGEARSIVLVATGWIAATGIIMCTPILVWCLIEELVNAIRRKINPPIEDLNLSTRAYNLLRRHGFDTIASVETASDATMLMLSNMDPRALNEIRRSISLWRYQRWQERGFPADGMP